MCALAQFQPAQGPGAIVNAGLAGLEAGSSLMQRAEQMRRQREMDEQARQQFEMEKVKFAIQRPVLEAAARADVVSTNASVDTATQMQNLRLRASEVAPTANEEFIGATALPDWGQQYTALTQLRGRYQWMANVRDQKGQPLYTDFLKQIDDTRALAIQQYEVDKQAKERMGIAKLQAESRAELEGVKGENALLRAQTTAAAKRTPSQQKFEEERGTAAAKYYGTVQEGVKTHTATVENIRQQRRALAAGGRQGFGETVKTDVMKALNTAATSLGQPEIFDTTKEETLQKGYANMAVDAAARLRGQGQITEAERKLLQDTVAQFGNSPKAALAIMGFMEAVSRREIDKARAYSQRVNAGEMVDQSLDRDFYEANPLERYMEAVDMEDEKPAASSDLEARLAKYRKK